jgi:hypothetical protein
MPPWWTSQYLHPDEGQPQTSAQNQSPFHHPSTQTLPTITEGLKHLAFGDIPEIQLQQPTNNISTTAPGASQNDRGTSSTQTNRGNPHQSPLQEPSPAQVIQGDAEPDQVQVQDWDEEAYEGEAAKEEEELISVQVEIERLYQEQESILIRQIAAQRAEAQRQHINKERVKLAELQYNIDILRQ